MSARRQRILAWSGLAAAAALGAVLVLTLWDGGGAGAPEPTVASPRGIDAYGDLDRSRVRFGDTLTAFVEITVDRTRIDPGSLRVDTDFAPWQAIGAPKLIRHDGKSRTYVELRYTLRCLESFCVTPGAESVASLRPARIRYVERTGAAGGPQARMVQAPFPQFLAVARSAPPGGSTAQAPARFRANLVSLPAATYRLGPWIVVALLLAGAALLAIAAVLIALRLQPRATTAVAVAPAEPAGPRITPLESALALLENATHVNGSGDQRRALELVAEGLLAYGDRFLARSARALAWSRSVPKSEETRGLARKARSVFGSREKADAPTR